MKKKAAAAPKLKPSPSQAGRALGSGFARLSGAAAQRHEHQLAAISAGFRNAAARDIETAELSCDDDFLRSLGF